MVALMGWGVEKQSSLSDFKPMAVELVLFDSTPIAMLCLLQIGGTPCQP